VSGPVVGERQLPKSRGSECTRVGNGPTLVLVSGRTIALALVKMLKKGDLPIGTPWEHQEATGGWGLGIPSPAAAPTGRWPRSPARGVCRRRQQLPCGYVAAPDLPASPSGVVPDG
jgi:hypothetical protein